MITESDCAPTPQDRPLRADAERNRRRILEAARELFAQRGLGVTLNDVARHAGVGVGTVYRRFPDKHALIEELFEVRIEELEARLRAALEDPDPWAGIVNFLRDVVTLQANDQGLREIVTEMPGGLERVRSIRERMLPLGSELVRRAHAAGALREDIVAQDMPLIQLMLRAMIDATRDVDPDAWRRYLAIVLRGISARPEAVTLDTPPVAPQDIERVMSASKRHDR